MFLRKIIVSYLSVGLFLYFTFLYVANNSFGGRWLYMASFATFVIFAIAIFSCCQQNSSFYSSTNLGLFVFFISLIEVSVYHYISYQLEGDAFVFSKIDSMIYYDNSMKMSKMTSGESLKYLLKIANTDDWGAFLWITGVFRIHPSQTFLGLCNCLISTLSSILLFKTGNFIMPKRYSFLAVLSFSIASFTTVFHACVLKETVFVFCIISSFYFYYRYLVKKRIADLLFSILFTLLILLFRIPVFLILLASFGVTYAVVKSNNRIVAVSIVTILVVTLISSSLFDLTYSKYLRGGDFDLMVDRKMRLAGTGGFVNQVTDPLAAIIGPFPSIVPVDIAKTSLYASGLLFRLLLAFPFIMGTYTAVKYKRKEMIPFIIFFFINAFGVAVSVKGLELRLSFPHLPVVFLVAFWWMAYYDYHLLPRIPRWIINGSIACVLAVSVLWNCRFMI